MTTNPTGPELFTSSAESLDDAHNEAAGTEIERYLLDKAAILATQAQTAALVMLTETIANATGTGHHDLDAWRLAIRPEAPWTTVTYEVDGETVEDGEEGELWEATYRVPQNLADDSPDMSEATAEQYSRPTFRRVARRPEPKHVLLPVGTRVLVSDPRGTNCGCSSAQPYVGIVRGYDMHRSKYQISEERYGQPGEYYDFVRWAFADNRVQPHPEQPASEPDTALTELLARFERVWDCEVFRSGYHNNATCTPDEPHSGWNCCYVWKFPLLTDKGAREIGITTDTEDTQ